MAVKTDYLSAFSRKYREHRGNPLQNLQNPSRRPPEGRFQTRPLPSPPYETYETPRDDSEALDLDTPPITIPYSWRHDVAGWPHDRWIRWRRMVDQLVAQEGDPTNIETINLAEKISFNAFTHGDPIPCP